MAQEQQVPTIPAPPTGAPAIPVQENTVKSAIQTPALDFLLNSKGATEKNVGSVSELPNLGAAEQEALKEKIKSLNSLTSPGFDNPVVRTRFEKYLNEPPASAKDVERYLDLVKKIQESLQRHNDREAWQMLQKLSDFEWDAGIGDALAARVEATWDMKLTSAQLDEKVRRLQKQIQSASWNVDMMSKPSSLSGGGDTPRSLAARGQPPQRGGGPSPAITADSIPFVEGKMSSVVEYLKVVEGRTRAKVSELKEDAMELKNKTDFQEYVGTLFAARRHLHTVLAADFYRCLYGEGDYPPTMAAQVNAAKEALRDVDRAVVVAKYKVQKKELAGATEHLLNAFIASEFHTAMQTLPLEIKQQIQSLGFRIVRLQNMLEARDFGNVEPLLKDIQAMAVDFDATKPRSIVEAVKLESRLRLGNAKLAAQQGDLKTAMSEFRSAAQTWPGNPDLNVAQLGFFNSQDTKNQLLQEFDQLFEAKNYRAIFDKQLPLATALVGDKDRIEHMKVALEKVKGVEMAIEKANIFHRNNNPFGAWETLERAAGEWPDDPKINRLLAESSADSADFVRQLKKGEAAEKTGLYGYSLACYLNAQRVYPASDTAREAIERLSGRILKKKAPSHVSP